MGLLDTEILSNRFDVENSLNNSMNERAMSFGALDRTAYAPMTAANALQGDMQGQAIGGMLGGRQIAMQKQDIIDDIMSRNPDPRTSTELRNVAKEFAQAGLTDYSFQITEVANQLYKTEIEKNTSTDKDYLNVGKTLSNNLLTRPVVEVYAKQLYGYTDADWEEATPVDINRMLKDAKSELQGQIDNYANRLRMDNISKTDIKKLMSNDATFTQDFFQDLTQFGNTDIVNFLQSVVKFDTTGNKSTMVVNPEFRTELRPNDMELMDDAVLAQSIIDLQNTKKMSEIQKENLRLLVKEQTRRGESSLNNAGSEAIETRRTYLKSQHSQRNNESNEEYENRINSMLQSEGATTTSMNNFGVTDDNVSSWIVPTGLVG
jgi:hypothetical protein